MVQYNKRTDRYEVFDIESLDDFELSEIWEMTGGGSGYYI
jgi:hypothetical protein